MAVRPWASDEGSSSARSQDDGCPVRASIAAPWTSTLAPDTTIAAVVLVHHDGPPPSAPFAHHLPVVALEAPGLPQGRWRTCRGDCEAVWGRRHVQESSQTSREQLCRDTSCHR